MSIKKTIEIESSLVARFLSAIDIDAGPIIKSKDYKIVDYKRFEKDNIVDLIYTLEVNYKLKSINGWQCVALINRKNIYILDDSIEGLDKDLSEYKCPSCNKRNSNMYLYIMMNEETKEIVAYHDICFRQSQNVDTFVFGIYKNIAHILYNDYSSDSVKNKSNFNLQYVLPKICAIIRKYDFIPKSDENVDNISTHARLINHLGIKDSYYSAMVNRIDNNEIEVIDEDVKLANDFYSWYKNNYFPYEDLESLENLIQNKSKASIFFSIRNCFEYNTAFKDAYSKLCVALNIYLTPFRIIKMKKEFGHMYKIGDKLTLKVKFKKHQTCKNNSMMLVFEDDCGINFVSWVSPSTLGTILGTNRYYWDAPYDTSSNQLKTGKWYAFDASISNFNKDYGNFIIRIENITKSLLSTTRIRNYPDIAKKSPFEYYGDTFEDGARDEMKDCII